MFSFSKNTQKKKKNIKIQYQIRSKRIQRNTCNIGFQNIGRQLKFRSNLRWVNCQILNHRYAT